ncbi:Deoxyribodipyrimidine photo-lyase [Dirofilaria immitis]
MKSARIQPLNRQNIFAGKYVLLLARSIRSQHSPSFSFASQKANKYKVPLLVVYIYQADRHNLAQRKFLLEGLNCLKNNLSRLHVPLLIVKASNNEEATEIILKLSEVACEVVTDAAYLREDRNFDENLNDKFVIRCRRFTQVEGNVTIPAMVLCSKPAYNANTIRKVAWHILDDFLAEEWNVTPETYCESWKNVVEYNLDCIDVSLEHIRAVDDCKTSSKLKGGETAARQVLDYFIANSLNSYDKERNIPNSGKQSFLSPYIHFGMLNPVVIVKEVKQSKAPKSAKDAFLEELVIRRELAHNFVYYYRTTYDTFDCLPEWVKKTMNEHRLDKREYIYSYKELEEGCTHDIYWNAAQFELVFTHKMSGYLRMYWAKKVIEWSSDYESAYTFLIEQNDKYELDGRDPNGYCGVMWNFGMHDRAHSNRPVFGKIRYMCADGIRRKFRNHINEYVNINYKHAGRSLKLNNHSQIKTIEASRNFEPKLKRRFMSGRHREPYVVNAEKPARVPHHKPRSKLAISWDRLLYNTRYVSRHWKDRILVKAVAAVFAYTIGLYVFIKKYYGNEHPLNRYQWRQMKKNSQLSEEMLHKEEVVQNYMKTRFDRIYEKEPAYSVRRQGPPGVI